MTAPPPVQEAASNPSRSIWQTLSQNLSTSWSQPPIESDSLDLESSCSNSIYGEDDISDVASSSSVASWASVMSHNGVKYREHLPLPLSNQYKSNGVYQPNQSNGIPSATPPPPLTESRFREPSGLKRTHSSPGQLALSGSKPKRRSKVAVGFLFSLHEGHTSKDFDKLKVFILDRFALLEMQALIVKRDISTALQNYLSREMFTEYIDKSVDRYFDDLNSLSSGKFLKDNSWQMANLGGMVGSCKEKNNIVEMICDLYEKYDKPGNNYFMSSSITAVLSSHLTWSDAIYRPDWFKNMSYSKQRLIDCYGGTGFPCRIFFVSEDVQLLEGFAYLLSYFLRDKIFLKNDPNIEKISTPKVIDLSVIHQRKCCSFGEILFSTVTEAKKSGSLIIVDEIPAHPNAKVIRDNNKYIETITEESSSLSEDTFCNSMSSHLSNYSLNNGYNGFNGSTSDLDKSESGSPSHKYPNHCTTFIDHALGCELQEDSSIVPNNLNRPLIRRSYHPTAPVMGVRNKVDVIQHIQTQGLEVLYDYFNVNNMPCPQSTVVVNDAINFRCDVFKYCPALAQHDPPALRVNHMSAAFFVQNMLKKFRKLKNLTGGSQSSVISTQVLCQIQLAPQYRPFVDCPPPPQYCRLFFHVSNRFFLVIYDSQVTAVFPIPPFFQYRRFSNTVVFPILPFSVSPKSSGIPVLGGGGVDCSSTF